MVRQNPVCWMAAFTAWRSAIGHAAHRTTWLLLAFSFAVLTSASSSSLADVFRGHAGGTVLFAQPLSIEEGAAGISYPDRTWAELDGGALTMSFAGTTINCFDYTVDIPPETDLVIVDTAPNDAAPAVYFDYVVNAIDVNNDGVADGLTGMGTLIDPPSPTCISDAPWDNDNIQCMFFYDLDSTYVGCTSTLVLAVDDVDGGNFDLNSLVLLAGCPAEDPSCGDCNNNGTVDACDPDCNGNRVADECEIDLNSSAPGGPYYCDPAAPPPSLGACDPDCNLNSIPDNCEWATQIVKLHGEDTSNTLEDYFGSAVATDGNTLVVGAIYDDDAGDTVGSVYVYERSDPGTPADPTDDQWTRAARLFPGDSTEALYFGASVAVQGDTIVVGAPGTSTAGLGAGAAYVFVRGHDGDDEWDEGSVDQQAKLLPDDLFGPGDAERFGAAVAIDGDRIVASATHFGASTPGAVYVFRRGVNNTWDDGGTDTEARLTPCESITNDWFGFRVAIDDDVIVVGDPRRFNGQGGQNGGWAVVFRRTLSDNNVWDDGCLDQEQILFAEETGVGEGYGYGVSLDGGTIVVGSPNHDATGEGTTGATYVYAWDGAQWVRQAKLLPEDNVPGDQFSGNGVAIVGDTIVVATLTDDESVMDSGSAYVFRRGPNGAWDNDAVDQYAKLVPDDADLGATFGSSLAFSSNWIVVGSDHDDDACAGAAVCDSGSAYVFALSGDCNANETLDWCDIAQGTSPDGNDNGIPDECEGIIPAVSEWGLVAMSLLVLTAGTLVYARRNPARVWSLS